MAKFSALNEFLTVLWILAKLLQKAVKNFIVFERSEFMKFRFFGAIWR